MNRPVFRRFSRREKVSTRIMVRGLLIQASIGVHPHEHEQTQPVVIDIELDMGGMALPKGDRLSETLDYALVAEAAERIALKAHVQLVETLAERIADWALAEDSRVQRVAVSIAKPQALLKADAAGVEVVKSR
ncbi:dihydroneopterin aldolase [uncultured Algimonas sp.]|uniref:dihydroneopterin aldolase n=1 Tax=uncultured Algimonas sp. TaxID=1547920 RepID=UPI002606A819|nr:dihydroneopterin aldolase [uncultured Algimonas sp.]